MKKITILYFIVFVSIACQNNKHTSAFSVDSKQADERGYTTLSSFVDECKITYLEADTQSFIGDIDKIIKYKNRFYITCDFKKLFIFDENGAFIKKIDGRGNGPQEYRMIADFDVCEEKLIIADCFKINFYSLLGKYLYSKNLDFMVSTMKCTPDNKLLFATSNNDFIIYLTDLNGNIIDKTLNKNQSLTLGFIPFIRLGTKLLYQKGYSGDYLAYDFKNGQFSDYTLLANKNYLSNNKEEELIEQYGFDYFDYIGEYMPIHGLATSNDDILVIYQKYKEKYLTCLNHKTNQFTNLKCSNLVDDISFTDDIFLSNTINNSGNNAFISYVWPYDIKLGLNKFKTKHEKYMNNNYAKMEENIISLKSVENSNPVIIEFKLK